MKLVIISSGNFFSTYGGGQNYVANLVNEVARCKNISTTVISLDEGISGNNIKKELHQNIPVYTLSSKTKPTLIKELLLQIQPNIVHAHGAKSLFCSLCHDLKIPIIITAHHGGIVCPAGSLLNHKDEICHQRASHHNCLPCCLKNIRSGAYWYPFMRLLPSNVYQTLGKSLRKLPFIPFLTPIGAVACSIVAKNTEWQIICDTCTHMIAPSKAIAEAMERNGMPKEKINIIPHGIPLPPPISKSKNIEDPLSFFYVGRISYVKGIHILLEAFHSLENNSVALHLIGGTANKAEERYMMHFRKKYQSDSRIFWHGKIPAEQLFDAIAPYSIMVHPAICMEIFGLTISEALAMGKPVLATRCGGTEMQIVDAQNGWLIPPNSVKEMKEKMEQIIDQPFTLSALPMTNNVISIQQHTQALVDLYEKTTHRR